MKYELPKLSYSYDALEPYIDAKTMEIHYTKHHQAYIDKLNAVLVKYPRLNFWTGAEGTNSRSESKNLGGPADKKLEDLMQDLLQLPVEEADRTALKNHGGGHLNHSLFWQIMGPQKEVDQELAGEIEKTFGSADEFKKMFTQAASAHFGSGWAWLVRDESDKLQVYSLPNQDSPYLKGHKPIIGLDIWEHAYYLKYQNRRAEYIENWWRVLKIF